MERFEVTTTLCADRRLAILAIAGDLDLGSAERFWPKLERLLTARAGEAVYLEDPLDAVVLDATSLEFLDSSGLRVLLRGARLAEAGGTAFRLVASHPAVRRVLELAGAFRPLDVRPSLQEALA
ncbi:MAG TPA: STAS domain-containing protein [Actinospica sp.]|nr:STAS domain-containing protein [Actinospica sp.]